MARKIKKPKPITIFDLDGTLCDVRHRVQFAEARLWDEFNKRSYADTPIPNVAHLFKHYDYNHRYICVMTARPERYRRVTEMWLRKMKLWSRTTLMYMRPDNDWRPAPEVKQTLLDKLLTEYDVSPILAFEDDERCAKMFRSNNIQCFLVDDKIY